MSKIYVPSAGPESWKQFLAKPDLHWKTGYSARTLAHCWEASSGLPSEIAAVFKASEAFGHRDPELLVAIPEYRVSLPGGERESQNDLLVIARCDGKTIAIAIEGKVAEPFGPTIAKWSENLSAGKRARLEYLCAALGVNFPPAGYLHYQLFHRAASALIEAERFKTDEAIMIVHSFATDRKWFAEYSAFVNYLGGEPKIGELTSLGTRSGKPFHMAWVCGDPQFLAR
jgi:hypothetical protein